MIPLLTRASSAKEGPSQHERIQAVAAHPDTKVICSLLDARGEEPGLRFGSRACGWLSTAAARLPLADALQSL